MKKSLSLLILFSIVSVYSCGGGGESAVSMSSEAEPSKSYFVYKVYNATTGDSSLYLFNPDNHKSSLVVSHVADETLVNHCDYNVLSSYFSNFYTKYLVYAKGDSVYKVDLTSGSDHCPVLVASFPSNVTSVKTTYEVNSLPVAVEVTLSSGNKSVFSLSSSGITPDSGNYSMVGESYDFVNGKFNGVMVANSTDSIVYFCKFDDSGISNCVSFLGYAGNLRYVGQDKKGDMFFSYKSTITGVYGYYNRLSVFYPSNNTAERLEDTLSLINNPQVVDGVVYYSIGKSILKVNPAVSSTPSYVFNGTDEIASFITDGNTFGIKEINTTTGLAKIIYKRDMLAAPDNIDSYYVNSDDSINFSFLGVYRGAIAYTYSNDTVKKVNFYNGTMVSHDNSTVVGFSEPETFSSPSFMFVDDILKIKYFILQTGVLDKLKISAVYPDNGSEALNYGLYSNITNVSFVAGIGDVIFGDVSSSDTGTSDLILLNMTSPSLTVIPTTGENERALDVFWY